MERLLYDEMFRIEESHWWFAARRKIIMHIIENILHNIKSEHQEITICDLGCGCGATLRALSKKYNVLGMDSSDDAIRFCRERGLIIQKGSLPYNIPYEENQFDVVLLLDVLEHIEEDEKALQKAVSLLKPTGIIIVTVPAYQWLWSPHDVFHHHKRRYDKKRLLKMFMSFPDMTPILLSYFNTLLFPLALIERTFSRFLKKKQETYLLPQPNRVINIIFEKIFALERLLIPRMNLPVGLSIIAIFQKGTTSHKTLC
ncbi:MAG: class I SAM-dependent methyltransferase [Deltaproteobacteria bacterium]|nr:class I SAM-dependent methyltransferase [Deltaproteobacteria bacterium]